MGNSYGIHRFFCGAENLRNEPGDCKRIFQKQVAVEILLAALHGFVILVDHLFRVNPSSHPMVCDAF